VNKKRGIPPVRVLPEDVANKIAAGEVVERPASVVKELVENSLDAGATRIVVRVIGAGRRLIEVTDNGHGMGPQDALLSIERHATSKVRKAEDLETIRTLGFRGEALPSIAAVSRFELVTRREDDTAATHIQVDGGILRASGDASGPSGTRVTVNRLYFNTPARAKFLKGITTELSHCIDVVQRHALAHRGVGFQFFHNDKRLLDIPEGATLRERIALIWGLKFLEDLIEFDREEAGFKFTGYIGTPALTRSSRSHQLFFLNGRPVMNRALQFGFEEGYQGLLTIGRHPVGVVLIEVHPRFADINIHPSKREIRFRDERAARAAIRDAVRKTLDDLGAARPPAADNVIPGPHAWNLPREVRPAAPSSMSSGGAVATTPAAAPSPWAARVVRPAWSPAPAVAAAAGPAVEKPAAEQTEFGVQGMGPSLEPSAVYRPVGGALQALPMQLFDTYLLIPEEDRLLIIDQHALHERLNYDELVRELNDHDYAAQQLAVPILVDVTPAAARLIESKRDLFSKLGIEIEPFGGNTFQVTAICHLYDEARVPDAVYRVLDALAQGDLFDREEFMGDLLRLATEACRASVKAGDRLGPEEKAELIEGFRRMRPPYTCPHGRPIITELTLDQMERSFRRKQ
jgi:DNA mismatch repair protein MutL